MTSLARSFKPITQSDLRRLGDIAVRDLEWLFNQHPDAGRLYCDRLPAIVLCQGAASHFLDGKNGVENFAVWSFFRAHPARPFRFHRNASADFGDPKFGKSPNWERFVGRRVDLRKRAIYASPGGSPVEPLRSYLCARRSAAARALAEYAMILLYPRDQLGTIVWPAEIQLEKTVRSPVVEGANADTGLWHDRNPVPPLEFPRSFRHPPRSADS